MIASKLLQILGWLVFFTTVFVAGFVITFYFLDDAGRVTKRFCNKFAIGASLSEIENEGNKFAADFSVSKDKKVAGLSRSSGIFTFAGCYLKLENEHLVSKQHWVD